METQPAGKPVNPPAGHLEARVAERYGVVVGAQGAAELRNLIHKRHKHKLAGRQAYVGVATNGCELWDVFYRGQWMRLVYKPAARVVVTALPREFVTRRPSPEEIET
jgi:hypothetical protein